METHEAYRELGLKPSASDAELKASWRRLVAAWHPDRNPAAGASSRMQSINKAYQHIRQLRDGGGSGGNGANGDRDAHPDAAHTPSGTASRSTDAEADSVPKAHVRKVRLSMEDAILGCTRTLRGHVSQTCGACAGQGLRVLAQACSTCRGSGAVRKPALFGWLWNQEACADCGGDGRLRAPCNGCDGSGNQSIAYRRRVRFPPGVRAGHVLGVPASHLAGQELGLELLIEHEPHPLFVLDEQGVLRCEMPVNGYAWMAGRWVEVPTPDGLQQMRLNRNALVYRLAGQGFPAEPRGARGDYLVKVLPVFGAQDDPAQEALLDQLIAASSRAAEADPHQPLGSWQERLKRWSASHQDAAAAE